MFMLSSSQSYKNYVLVNQNIFPKQGRRLLKQWYSRAASCLTATGNGMSLGTPQIWKNLNEINN